MILAAASVAGYSIVQVAITVVVVAAIFALVFVALRQFGVAIPPWAIQAFWIVAVTVVIVGAILLVASLF